MAWDPALLRKYNNTNHFKLLNQVRSDLKEQPIQRSSSSTSQSQSQSLRRSGGSARRRTAPSPQPAPVASPSTPANSFDPIVTVPVLIEAFD